MKKFLKDFPLIIVVAALIVACMLVFFWIARSFALTPSGYALKMDIAIALLIFDLGCLFYYERRERRRRQAYLAKRRVTR